MRVLFSTLPSRGHFYPMVPLAWALRSGGHEVAVAATGAFSPAVAAAGLNPLGTVDDLDMRRLIGEDRQGRPVPDPQDTEGKLHRSGRGFGRASAAALPAMTELLTAYRPDLVVGEPTDFAGRLAAYAAGIPHMVHAWGLPVPRAMADGVVSELRPELSGLGLAEPPPPGLFVDVCPPSLRPGDGPASGAPSLAMRYTPFNGSGALPDWALGPPATRPRVCVTFGTMIGGYPGAAQSIAALASVLIASGYEVVAAVGDDLAPQVRELVPQARHVGWLPLHAVLPACDVLVHHGGSGSAMTALCTGVPQVVTPYATDQFSNAGHVERAGAGLRIDRGGSGPEEVAEACTRVIENPAFTRQSRALQQEISLQPSPADVATNLASALSRDLPPAPAAQPAANGL
ncbi:nucleotide disphospho-sugar-binding domain-containing protein [Streptomyces sp. NPDC018019]|uniref:nucleotide disphospho-sugar-binding domain-containing protein n=1 Tax=Streptomyces sp. NPDC018019 TaxID=3365030 RepID=UPI0037A12437